MTVERLLVENARARGGTAALEAVQAIRLDLEITEPGFTVTADYVATRDGYMRIDVYAGEERAFTEALGPAGGWQWLPGASETVALTEQGIAALERGLHGNLLGLHELPALGYRFTLEGEAEHHREQRWIMKQQAPDGFVQYLYLDQQTFLEVASSEISALHPDVDATEKATETFYSEFNDSEGVVIAMATRKVDMETGEEMQRTRITRLEINPSIENRQFLAPDHNDAAPLY
jgi:hypothetical protein